MSLKHHPVILVAPLDWGLGHSARCVPIIKHLLSTNCKVLVAAEGKSYKLLKKEFPELKFLALRGYNVQYANSKRLLLFKILWQIPKILKIIKEENLWLAHISEKYKLDGVISDNRYGLWHRQLPCVFITHQLKIKGPNKWIERWLLKQNYQQLNKFNYCWIPDFEGKSNLAGELSHPPILPSLTTRYIGPLSRLTHPTNHAVVYDLLVLLSGPEPQRTLLENILLFELGTYQGNVLFVRGLPGEATTPPAFNSVCLINHLSAEKMAVAFMQSAMIVCRAGYTTVMDIVKLRKKSIMIPTPGQTEQEYLALHLQEQKITITFKQTGFNLNEALEHAATFNYNLPEIPMDSYKQVVDNWVADLRAAKALPQGLN